MTHLLYAFSGDPITKGHEDIITRAAAVADNVTVLLGNNSGKNYLFSKEVRLDLTKKSLGVLPNVNVLAYDGIIVDFVYSNNINGIVKGIRDAKDLDYEKSLVSVNKNIQPSIETLALFTNPNLAHVSSTLVKLIQEDHGNLSSYVSLPVKQALEKKVSNQYLVNITGVPGAGKSYIANQLVKLGDERGVPVHNIEFDHLAHNVLKASNSYMYIRREIADYFGDVVLDLDGGINRDLLRPKIFGHAESGEKLNDILKDSIMAEYRSALKGKEGILLLNNALLAEMNLSYLGNHETILVTVDKTLQHERLRKRNLRNDEISVLLESQYAQDKKKSVLDELIVDSNFGNLYCFHNGLASSQSVESLFKILDARWKNYEN